jgi:uncharacterized protein involved in exopolysaccharide biosynthesis
MVLAGRKRIIFGVTVVFTIVAIVYALSKPNVYTATLSLLPPQSDASMNTGLASQLGGLAALAGGSFSSRGSGDLYVTLFKSRVVGDAMVQHFGLMQEYHTGRLSEASSAFQEHTTVISGSGGLIYIAVTDRDPRRAAELANGYVDQFRNLSQHLAITEASQRRLFFEQELEKAKVNLADAEEAFMQTEQTTGVIQPDSQASALIGSAVSLRTQIAEREVQIRGMQTYATGENAELVQAQRELEGLRAQLAKLGGSAGGSSSEFLISKGRVPETSLEYIRKQRDVRYYETIFEFLEHQVESAKLDEAKQGGLIQVLDPAIPPDRRSSPNRRFIVLAGTVIGFFVGLLVAMFHAGFQHLRSKPEVTVKLRSLVRTLFLMRQRTS